MLRFQFFEDSLMHLWHSDYKTAVKGTARLTDEQVELGEDSKAALEIKLRILSDELFNHPEVEIIYFQAAYINAIGTIKKIDEYERVLLMMDRAKILIEAIIEIEGGSLQSISLISLAL